MVYSASEQVYDLKQVEDQAGNQGMVEKAMTIGELARRAGLSVPTVRYYESRGLLPGVERRAGGHQVYDRATLERATFVKRCRDLEMPIATIKDLLSAASDGAAPCANAFERARRHLGEIRARIEALSALEANLMAMVERCGLTCCGGPVRDCSIYTDLAG